MLAVVAVTKEKLLVVVALGVALPRVKLRVPICAVAPAGATCKIARLEKINNALNITLLEKTRRLKLMCEL